MPFLSFDLVQFYLFCYAGTKTIEMMLEREEKVYLNFYLAVPPCIPLRGYLCPAANPDDPPA